MVCESLESQTRLQEPLGSLGAMEEFYIFSFRLYRVIVFVLW
jgi:hypothetical protein